MSAANDRALELISTFMPNTPGRKALPATPPVTDANGNTLPRYLVEKLNGTRRENGAMKLKRLTARHYKIIGLHIEGKSLEQISRDCLVTVSTASRILNDPLAQEIIKKMYTHREAEIHALAGQAVEAVRSGLDDKQTVGTRLKAVQTYAKLRESLVGKDKGAESAEDVIARMLERGAIIGNNVQINVGGSK